MWRKALLILATVALLTGCVATEPGSENKTTQLTNSTSNQSVKNLTEKGNYTESDFLEALTRNKDIQEFAQNNQYTLDTEKITPEDIKERKDGDTSHLYEEVPMKTLYRIDIYNESGRGFQTMVDMEKKEILNIYKLIKVGV